MAPLIQELRESAEFNCRVIATAQHRELLDQVLRLFSIAPDVDLDVMRPNQALTELTARLLTKLDGVISDERPDTVLAQGDTTTVMAVALACFYRQIPFGHVEAGLRTHDMSNPFPEEMNRVVAGRLAKWHFCPTANSVSKLVREDVPREQIFLTGNTVIDALLEVAGRSQAELPIGNEGRRLILVTAHRRENFGEPLREICRTIRELADRYDDIHFLYPVHPNPNVQSVVFESLSDHPQIELCPPLEYPDLVSALKQSYFVLSDSGGIQEEAPALGKPVLVLRRETERPEAVEMGVARLVGPERAAILYEVSRLLDNDDAYLEMARGVSPYGDGRASWRIVNVLRDHFFGSTHGAPRFEPFPGH
jgi:UDP-N-acetylglucosamine 2-epimerase (non-hydrolysing)